ncbi:MAG: DUF5939 domain-containing protein [Candidatus Marinimicrobia bacterium]|nr:DUF5939 domain-containing protein [Candidatus Neomarinimicrobiota bacterium]MCF7902797.1 DUF5939 domain-containing protein [Candidatus Neomarinimicrobiota bacterium]
MVPKTLTDYIQRSTEDDNIRQALLALITQRDKRDMNHLQPFALADEWILNRDAVLASFIKGCEVGLFSLHWRTHCTRCGAFMDNGEHIHHLSDQETCMKCGNDYKSFLDENVEVSFSVVSRFSSSKFHFFRRLPLQSAPSDVRVTGVDCLLSPVFAEVFHDQTLSESESLSIRHITLLFTDIVDSTRIYATHGDIPAQPSQ